MRSIIWARLIAVMGALASGTLTLCYWAVNRLLSVQQEIQSFPDKLSALPLCMLWCFSHVQRVPLLEIFSKKCRWHVSDNFQFSLKGTTIYKTSRHSLLGTLDTASISLMDWLSYSDSAVLLSLYRRLCAPDCALQAVVFLPYHYTAVSGLLV